MKQLLHTSVSSDDVGLCSDRGHLLKN